MIYEFRTYEATPGNLPALNKHLEVAAGLFKKHGLGVMGFWTEEVGTGGQVNYMWVYEDPRGEAEEAGELRVGPRLEETGGRGGGLGGLSLPAAGRSGGALALGFGLGAGRVGLTALGGHGACFLLQGLNRDWKIVEPSSPSTVAGERSTTN